MERACNECGRIFEVDEGKRNWQCVIICSDDCRKARAARVKRGKYIKQLWPQTRACVWCGKDFKVEGPGGKPQLYCSRKCYLERKSKERAEEVEKNRQPKRCLQCGKPFLESKFNKGQQAYCSHECYFKARRKNSVTAKHRYANQTEFARARRIVLKRDNRTCVFCGRKEGRMEVHHVDLSGGKKESNGHPDNLITLCHNCHDGIHNVSLIRKDGKWAATGKIFNILKLQDSIPII